MARYRKTGFERKMKFGRAQASIEFLSTYGWAIMAVIIAISALAYFGIINPSRSLPDKCLFNNGIICRDYIISTNSFNVSLVNGAGQTIHEMKVVGDGFTTTCSLPSGLKALPDQEFKVNCGIVSITPPLVSGQSAKLKVKLTYQRKVGGFEHVSLGEIYSIVK